MYAEAYASFDPFVGYPYNRNPYIYSPKRLYFGILQEDGNFVVYSGTDPDDRHDPVWTTGVDISARSPGYEDLYIALDTDGNNKWWEVGIYAKFSGHWETLWASPRMTGDAVKTGVRAVVRDDGTFCIFSQNTAYPDPLWSSGTSDPLADFEIENIDYDVANYKLLNAAIVTVATAKQDNTGESTQTFTTGGNYTAARTAGWSDSLAVRIGAKTTFKAKIPFLGESNVELSVDVTNTYIWNGSTTWGETYSWSAPLTVKPGYRGHVFVTVTQSTIQVPYSMTGKVVFKSGKRIPRRIDGVYEGTNSHNATASYTSEKIGSDPTLGRSQPQEIPITVKRISDQ